MQKIKNASMAFFAAVTLYLGLMLLAQFTDLSQKDSTAVFYITTLLVQLCILLPAFLYAAWAGKEAVAWRKVRFKQVWLVALLAVCGYMISTYINIFSSILYSALGAKIPKSVIPASQPWMLWLDVFIVSILPAFCEELLFRGALQNAFSPLGRWRSVFISGAVFAVMHISGLHQFPALLFLGMTLGLIIYDFGSIKLTMVYHFTNNLIAVGLLSVSGQVPETVVDNIDTTLIFGTGALVLLPVFVVAAVLFRAVWRSLKRNGPDSVKVRNTFSSLGYYEEEPQSEQQPVHIQPRMQLNAPVLFAMTPLLLGTFVLVLLQLLSAIKIFS